AHLVEVGVASDEEARAAERPRKRRARRGRRPDHFVRLERFAETLELEEAERLECVTTAMGRDRADDLGDDDLTAARLLAEARCLDDGDSVPVVVFSGGLAVADADADAGHVTRVPPAQLLDALLYPHGTVERRADAREHRHDPVPDALDA